MSVFGQRQIQRQLQRQSQIKIQSQRQRQTEITSFFFFNQRLSMFGLVHQALFGQQIPQILEPKNTTRSIQIFMNGCYKNTSLGPK